MSETTQAYITEGPLWGTVVVCLPNGEQLKCHNLATARRERDKYNREQEAVAKCPQGSDLAAVLRSGERAKLFRTGRSQS